MQKKCYGKAKQHTMNTQYTTTYDDRIVHESAPVEGNNLRFVFFKQDNGAFPRRD